jgi:hypothetical protein
MVDDGRLVGSDVLRKGEMSEHFDTTASERMHISHQRENRLACSAKSCSGYYLIAFSSGEKRNSTRRLPWKRNRAQNLSTTLREETPLWSGLAGLTAAPENNQSGRQHPRPLLQQNATVVDRECRAVWPNSFPQTAARGTGIRLAQNEPERMQRNPTEAIAATFPNVQVFAVSRGQGLSGSARMTYLCPSAPPASASGIPSSSNPRS